MNKKILFRAGILLLSAIAAEAVAVAVPDSAKHQPANQPYFAWLIIAITLVYFVGVILIHLKNRKTPNESDLFYRAPFLAGVLLVLNVLNIVTVKTALLPTLYFPSLDRVFGTLFEDWELILKCVGYSSGILAAGVLGGLIVGFLMGVGIGFSKTLSYWDKPAGTYSGSDTVNSVDTDFPAGFPDCTCSQRIYHRDLRLVPDGGADLQRYLKRKELVFRGRLHAGSKSLLARFQGRSARRNA